MTFRPTRTSPVSKISSLAHSLLESGDLTRSSAVSIQELVGLSTYDVELIDAIVDRAGPESSTFPAIFAAYNAILKEWDVDPSEVIYYGKLLKLGTLKGSSWSQKWQAVKEQQGYGIRAARTKRRVAPTLPLHSPVSPFPRSLQLDDDTTASERSEARSAAPQYHQTRRRGFSPTPSEQTSVISSPSEYLSRRHQPTPLMRISAGSDQSDTTEGPAAPSTTPPSYRAIMRDPPPVSLPSKRPSASSLAVAREKLAQVRQRGGSVTNEDDAWKKIKMIEDEKLADRVRNEKLVERCWDVWKQGFDWIATTSDQVADARDNVTLRLCMHRWKLRVAGSQQLQDRIVRLANQRVLQSIFKAWKAKARERAQARWRASMRAKMKTVRDKREDKLLMNAFGIWSERYRARLADQHYAMTLLVRFYSRWRHRLGHLEHLDDYAQAFLRTLDNGVLERRWFYWKHAVQLQMAEHMVVRNVALRLISQVLDIWRRRLENNHVADLQYQSFLKRRSIVGWKKARHSLEFMNEKAIMHVSLKDERLLKAKYSLMRIRYFGRRLEVIAGQRGLADAWNLWKAQLQAAKAREAIAVAHSLQTNSVLAVSALEKWRNVYLSHQNAQTFADQRYDSVVQAKLLFAWRIKLREKYKLMRRARALFNHLVLRSAWGRMRESLAEKRRVNKLKLVEARQVQRVFVVWREMACRQQNMRRVEAMVRLAILERALRKWTDRTIEVKNRELQIVLDRKSTLLQRTYNKWKWARGRHIEEVSLLESYNLVKREEDTRKIFYRWLAAARTTRHRRITLERSEAEMQLRIVAVAWGRWREQFKNRQLQPIEYDVILQRQHNTLYHVFMLWQSKAQTLPAIRFNARRVKTAHWKIWLRALPRALQHKEAKEIDRRRMLIKSLRQWSEAYRTKIALKAVARARYMRLPTAIKHVPARSTVTSRPTIPAPAARSVFPRRRNNTEDQSSVGSEDEERFTEPSRWRQHSRFAAPRSVRSEISPPRRPQPMPVTRASSPARSTFAPRPVIFPPRPSSSTAGDEGRAPTSLLHELRQLQMRGKSPSERSRTRESP